MTGLGQNLIRHLEPRRANGGAFLLGLVLMGV